MQRTIYAILLIGFTLLTGFAQSPPELNSSINYDSDPNMPGEQSDRATVAGIASAFDNGRRVEEQQFTLPNNSLGNLVMPIQAIWDGMNSNARIFYLLNAERVDRADVDYGNGPVKGLPLTGIESNLNAIAQIAAESYILNNITSLIDADVALGGSGCINNDTPPVNCCHELLGPNQPNTSSNSIIPAVKNYRITFQTSGMPVDDIEVRVVYALIYSFSRRLSVLIQDEDLNPSTSTAYGMDDNYGDIGDEGFLGIGIYNGPSPRGNGMDSTHVVLVLLDPVPESEGCNYNCITCTPCPNFISVNSIPYQDGVIQAENTVTAQGLVPSSGDVTMKAGDYVKLNPVFEVASGGIFHAYIDGCYFTLD